MPPAPAVSEAVDGAAAGRKRYLRVIIGTGCGAAAMSAHRRQRAAGEWGHNCCRGWMTMSCVDAKKFCYCGKQGCIETFISGTGFATDYQRLSGKALRR
ncbi:ROK family protein [Salmonella enterica subsp. enterica]|nr:ROK family protein [Salmonella enterica subsp. enterica]